MPNINRLKHLVLNCSDVEASIKFYTESLGMEVVNYNPETRMAFLSFGKEHHDIALFQFKGEGEKLEPNHVGLNHIALEIEGGEDELKEFYTKLQEQGVQIDRLADHAMSRSVYFFDPDGNRLEIFYETITEGTKEWLREHGGVSKTLASL